MKTSDLPIILLSMFFVASRLLAQEYTINLESGGQRMAVIELSIDNDKAIAKVGEVTDRFDLKNQARLTCIDGGQSLEVVIGTVARVGRTLAIGGSSKSDGTLLDIWSLKFVQHGMTAILVL